MPHERGLNINFNPWNFILGAFIAKTNNVFNYSFEITNYQIELLNENKEANVLWQFLKEPQ